MNLKSITVIFHFKDCLFMKFEISTESCNAVSTFTIINYIASSDTTDLVMLVDFTKTSLYFSPHYCFLLVKIDYCCFTLHWTFFANYGFLGLRNYSQVLFARTLKNFFSLDFKLWIYDYQTLSFFKYLLKMVFAIKIF